MVRQEKKFQFLKWQESTAVTEVILHRPQVRNAFHPQMIEEITRAFSMLSQQKHLRAVVLRGEGPIFCAGADLQWMKEMADYSKTENLQDAKVLFQMFETIWNCPHPILTYVQGSAFGGALGLLACSDLVIAAPGTQFCFSEVKLGLVPAVISYFVAKKIPLGFFNPLAIFGRVFTTEQAMQAGLVHYQELIDPPLLLEKCCKDFLDGRGVEAMKATKSLLREVGDLSVTTARQKTAKVIAERRVSQEGQAGLRTFLQKISGQVHS